jgi:hypothetical protein
LHERELRDTLAVDVDESYERLSSKIRQSGGAQLAHCSYRMDRIVVVLIQCLEVMAIGARLGGKDGVRCATRLLLHREMHANARQLYLAGVVVAHLLVLRANDETHVRDSRVGERADDVVEEWPADGDHALHARVSGDRLRVAQGGVRILAAHARPQASRENDCLGGRL